LSDEEQKFGLEGIEQSQGYEPMEIAHPVENPDDIPSADETMTREQLDYAKRPVEADWGHAVEREYYNNQTGEPTPENQTVSKEQASHDLTAARAAEAKARELEAEEALRAALDDQPPHQDQQPDQPQPETDIQPQPEADPAYAQATQDAELEKLLQNPALRERVTAEYQQMAAAVEQARGQYVEAANTVLAQAEALATINFPELAPYAGNQQQMAAALQMLQAKDPGRFAEVQDFARRAAVAVEHSQRVQAEQRQAQAQQMQAQAQQYAEAMDNYTKAEVKRYEQMTANESPETVRAIKENLGPIVEKHYGVPMETLMAIHNGKRFVDGTTFVRSAGFQAMLHDAIKFRLAQDGVRQARSNPIPRVQRPGVASEGPTTESEYASLEREFRGKSLNPKQAADLLIAHRARRG
jgi:hypothetical protein